MSVRPDGFTVWCDHDDCVEWTAQASFTHREAVRQARSEGWVRVRRDRRLLDLCPLHRPRNPATGVYNYGGVSHFFWKKEDEGR